MIHKSQYSLYNFLFGSLLVLSGYYQAATASQRRFLSPRETVAVYTSGTSSVLDRQWDPVGPANIEKQLQKLSFSIARVEDDADVQSIDSTTAAYIIPVNSGDLTYSEASQSVEALSRYVQAGGVVIVHDSTRRQDATQRLIAEILGYEGVWQHCETVTDNSRSALGGAGLSNYAREFLPGSWPRRLEDVRHIQVHSWCKHADPSAVSYPLYVLHGDPMQAVAQAFGRVGVRGAVVWLGYSWRDGPVEGWGALLGHIIRSFAKGRYSPPSDSSFMDRYPLRLEALVDSVASLADDTAEAIRRLLSAAVVGSGAARLPYMGRGGYGGYGYGDYGGYGYGGYGSGDVGGYGGYGSPGGYGYGGHGATIIKADPLDSLVQGLIRSAGGPRKPARLRWRG